jgi:hypothetical protein
MLIVQGLELCDDVRLIKKYANFCLSKFVKNSILRKSIITIKIINRDELSCKEERKELKESSAWMTYDGTTDDGKKLFTVILDKIVINNRAKKLLTRYKNLLKYMGHEMVHIKQYLLNEMFDYKDGETVRFAGQRYHYNSEKKDLDWDYWESPWEREAYSYQEALYYMFDREYARNWVTKEKKQA